MIARKRDRRAKRALKIERDESLESLAKLSNFTEYIAPVTSGEQLVDREEVQYANRVAPPRLITMQPENLPGGTPAD